ncbi:MAG TPA: glycine cleavage system aminomethyltransferase GcvT [Chthoniobacterales bacterium]
MSDSSTSENFQRTPLFDEHVRAGAKLIGFGGWEMPVFYTSILDEHQTVRNAAGVFDISHMGQVTVTGPDAEAFLNRVLTNNITKLASGQGQYTILLNENGGVIDDLIAYRTGPHTYFLVINASMIAEDVAWLESETEGDVTLENKSDDFAGLAVQGPASVALLEAFLGGNLPPRNGIANFIVRGTTITAARTGYTGEDGAELFLPATDGPRIWNELLDFGKVYGLKPCGLGARDTLRLEMCYPLNGSDLGPGITPIEAGLGFFVDLNKGEFVGRDVLARQKTEGVARKLAPFRMTAKSPPPRSHYPVTAGGEVVGETCSGGLSPSLGTGIGMAYLPPALAVPGTAIEIDIRGKKFPAVVERKPLYKKPKP